MGDVRIVDAKAEHVPEPVKSPIAAGKVATAIALFTYIDAMPTRAGRRRPSRVLFDVNPADDVDLDRLLPPNYQDWRDRVLRTTKSLICATARS